MRIEINLSIQQGTRQLFGVSNRMLPGELVSKKLGVVFCCQSDTLGEQLALCNGSL